MQGRCLLYASEIPLLGINLREWKLNVYSKTCTWIFIAILVIIIQTGNIPNVLQQMDEQMWYIRSMAYYSAIKRKNDWYAQQLGWKHCVMDSRFVFCVLYGRIPLLFKNVILIISSKHLFFSFTYIMNWTVSPQNSYVEALTANVTAFGNRTLREMVKVKQNHKGRVLV